MEKINIGQQHQQHQQITGTPLDAPADCTIACDKGHLTAHKLILCDHSKYLKDILSKYPTAEHPIIILTELNIIDIKILVNYMYTGELVITNDSSPTSLLRAAQILKIDSLTADESEQDDEEQLQGGGAGGGGGVGTGIDEDEDEDMIEDEIEVEEREREERDGRDVDEVDYDDDVVDDDEEDEEERMMSSKNKFSMSLNNPFDEHSLLAAAAAAAVAANNSNSNNHSSKNSRLINSINNIYSLNHFIDTTSTSSPPPPSQSHSNQQPQQSLLSSTGSHSTLDNKNNKIRCHLCNISLSDVKCLYRHVLTRHLPEKWGYKCEFCDREFSRDDHLMRHYTTKHKNMEFNREKIRETRRLNREMAKNFHDQISTA